MARQFCSIYKSSKKDEMYLYVLKSDGLKRVQEALLSIFGKAIHVSDMILTSERKLARVDVEQVLAQLTEQGFYLQMPPPPEPWIITPDSAPAWRRRSQAERERDEELS